MNASLWFIRESIWKVAQSVLAGLKAEEWVLLIIAAILLLAFSSLRARYLGFWSVGWIFLAGSRLAGLHGDAMRIPLRYVLAVEQTSFVLAMGLFAGGVLIYVGSRKLLTPLLAVTAGLAGLALAHALLWPESLPLRVAVEACYRFTLLAVAVISLRARRGRWEGWTWLLAASLVAQQLGSELLPGRLSSVPLAAKALLGVSMLMVALGEARSRERRLRALSRLGESTVLSQQPGPLIQECLEQLRSVIKSNSAWFRPIEGGEFVGPQGSGVSSDFLRGAGQTDLKEDLLRELRAGKPIAAMAWEGVPEEATLLRAENISYVTMLPVLGKNGLLALLSLGSRHARKLSVEESEFLETYCRQLGIAFENLRLWEQTLRAQRQWRNTFDSVHDSILAHDSRFGILKANETLLGRLQRASADVIGTKCEAVLPRRFGEWADCPYCARKSEESNSGADLCFGGFSMVSTSSYTEEGSKQKGTIHIIRDTSEQTSADARYRMLFEQVQEGVFVATPAGQLLDCNDAFARMLGYERREELLLLNLDADIRVDPAQRAALHRELSQRNGVRNFEMTMRRKNGTLLLAGESSYATRDADGEMDRYQGFILDVTEKRRSEDEMLRRNRELNALNAMAVVATQSFDLDEILNLTLRQVVSLFGVESGAVYLSDFDLPTYRRRAAWGPRSRDKSRPAEVSFAQGFGDLVTRSRAEVITSEYLPHLTGTVAEFIRSDSDGAWIWVLFWGQERPIGMMGLRNAEERAYSTGEENLMVAISRQLATTIEKVRLYEETCKAHEDLRRAQEQLLQSEQMSAVGQLITGVAQELNNPLGAVLGYAQLLEHEALNERAQEYVSKMSRQAQRTHEVLQNLLSLVHQREPETLDEVNATHNVSEEERIEAALSAGSAPRHEGALQGRVLLMEEDEAGLELERDVLIGAGASITIATCSDDVKTRLLSEPFDVLIMNGGMRSDWHAKQAWAWLTEHCPEMKKRVLFTFSDLAEHEEERAFLRETEVPYLKKPFAVAELILLARRLMPKKHAASASD